MHFSIFRPMTHTGDPIPDSEGVLPEQNRKELGSYEEGSLLTVKGVKDTSSGFLKYLEKMEIGIGSTVEVIDVVGFDESMQIRVNEKGVFNISKKISNNIYVVKP